MPSQDTGGFMENRWSPAERVRRTDVIEAKRIRATRSDEVRAKRNAKKNQRQRKRKTSISGSQNMMQTDSAQEA